MNTSNKLSTEDRSLFERQLRELLTDLFSRRLEYEDAQVNKRVNPNGENTDYFRGKADAYSYAHSQLLGLMKWHGFKL